MSHVPRPYIRSPSTCAENGSSIPSTPTVSRCPLSASEGPPPRPRCVATRLGRSGGPTISTWNPREPSLAARSSTARRSPGAPGTSAGLTVSSATSARVSSIASLMSLAIGRENPGLRPVVVAHLLDEDLDVLGSDAVGVDERFGDPRHQAPLQFDVARRLLHGNDRHGLPS